MLRPISARTLARRSIMCPECYANLALLITGVVSTGGVTAAAVRIFRSKRLAAKLSQARKPNTQNSKEKSQ
jgi:pyrroline-5-carboxylate reductase